jgi:prolyl 4-hydroxylase
LFHSENNILKLGNVKEALHLTRELVKIVPYHQHALGNIKHYEKLLLQQGISQEPKETAEYVPIILINELS